METQPNFAKVKDAFFNTIVSDKDLDIGLFIIKFNIATRYRLRQYHPKAVEQFRKELSSWVDSVDIRCVTQLIDYVNSKGICYLTPWIKSKQFTIDYNEHFALDLIELK